MASSLARLAMTRSLRPKRAAIRDSLMGRERGVALVVVIWVLALLTVLILGFTSGAHTELLLARNNYESARAAALADAGVSLALIGVLDTTSPTPWPADGGERDFSFGGGTVLVRVQDEGGKVNLNKASEELLAGLFRSLSLGSADGAGLATAIVDWRTRLGQSAVPPGVAGDDSGAFVSIEQLRLVPGFTREIYDRVKPFVTVYSPAATVDPLSAPAEVLRGLPGIDLHQLDAFLEARETMGSMPGALPGALPPLNNVARFLGHAPLHAATIRSVGQMPTGTRFIREAVFRVGNQAGQPYQFVAWRQGLDEAAGDVAGLIDRETGRR